MAVFVPKGDRVLGWKARGFGVENFNVPLAPDSLFSEVIIRKNYCRDLLQRDLEMMP